MTTTPTIHLVRNHESILAKVRRAAAVSEKVNMARHAVNGDVQVFHDGLQSTVEAIPRILGVLGQMGICTGGVTPTSIPEQAWRHCSGYDKKYYCAAATW